MPRNPKNRNLNATVTPAQYAAAKRRAAERGLSFSAYLRLLVALDVGESWPSDLATHGGKRPKKAVESENRDELREVLNFTPMTRTGSTSLVSGAYSRVLKCHRMGARLPG